MDRVVAFFTSGLCSRWERFKIRDLQIWLLLSKTKLFIPGILGGPEFGDTPMWPMQQTEGEGKLFSSHTILHRSLLDWCTKAPFWAIPVLREIQPTAVQPSTGDIW